MAQSNWQRPPFAGGPQHPRLLHGPPYNPLFPPPDIPSSHMPRAAPPAHQYPPRGILPPCSSLLKTTYSNAHPLNSPLEPPVYAPPPRTPPSWQGPAPLRPPALQSLNALTGLSPSRASASFPTPPGGSSPPFMAAVTNPQIGLAGSREMSSTISAASQNIPMAPHVPPGFFLFPFPPFGFFPRLPSPLPFSPPSVIQSQSATSGGASLGQAVSPFGITEVEEDTSEADSWSAHKGDDGIVYYFNATTGLSTFQKPLDLVFETQSGPPKPVSWERVAGTEWVVVTTDNRKKYYYNGKSQSTSWAVPLEVATARKLAQQSVTSQPAAGVGGEWARLDVIKKKLQELGRVGGGGEDAGFVPPSLAPDPPLGLLPVGPPPELEGEEEGGSGSVSSDVSSEEEGKKVVSASIKAACYKEMLIEKGIAPFAKWDKELPKILFDHRFKAIYNPIERRSLFDLFVRTRAEEERKEKRASQKAVVSGFNALLDEAQETFSHATGVSDLEAVLGKDARWSAIKLSDRSRLLKKRLAPLVAAESAKMAKIRHEARKGFMAMLEEQKNWTGSTRWAKVSSSLRSDLRYSAVSRDERVSLFEAHVEMIMDEERERREGRRRELLQKEEEAKSAARAKEEEEEKSKKRDFWCMLRECIATDVCHWSNAKRVARQDPRYGRLSKADRERVWEEYVEDRDEGGEKRRGRDGSKGRGRRGEEIEEMGDGEERAKQANKHANKHANRNSDKGKDRGRCMERDGHQKRDRSRDHDKGTERDRDNGSDRGRDDGAEREKKSERNEKMEN